LKKKLSIEQTLLNSGVRIYAPVAQKRPMRPMLADATPIDLADYNFFLIH
jgi:hypothetical protein